MPKTFRATQEEPGPQLCDYILLPYGYSYNKEYLSYKNGDKIKMFNGGTYQILSVSKIKTRDAYADALCRMRYGVGIKYALSHWKDNALLEGHGKKALSDEECLLLCYEKI